MKYEAVIFDFGGTLIHYVGWSAFEEAARGMASIVSAPAEDFVSLWSEESEGLGTGAFQTYQEFTRYICGKLGITVEDDLVNLAADVPLNSGRRMVSGVREGAIELLTYLKANNYKTGLISDCFIDLPAIWDETPFTLFIDVAVFSCSVGMTKGDTRIFQHAVEKLGVMPEECLFIADGMRQELANASKIGMDALQIYVPEEIDDSPIREKWSGPKILSLEEVLKYLE